MGYRDDPHLAGGLERVQHLLYKALINLQLLIVLFVTNKAGDRYSRIDAQGRVLSGSYSDVELSQCITSQCI